MTDDSGELRITTVPRDLYYHEVAYVRGLEQDIERLQAESKRLRDERDALYTHCNALIELLIQLNKNPVATYAAAYLTQIVPPEETSSKGE